MPSDLENATKKSTKAVTSLGRLIARMALDDVLHTRYLNDAAAVIAEAGLSKKETKALIDGNWLQILKLLGPGDRGGGPAQKDPGDEQGGP